MRKPHVLVVKSGSTAAIRSAAGAAAAGGSGGNISVWLITLCLGFATCSRGGFGTCCLYLFLSLFISVSFWGIQLK